MAWNSYPSLKDCPSRIGAMNHQTPEIPLIEVLVLVIIGAVFASILIWGFGAASGSLPSA